MKLLRVVRAGGKHRTYTESKQKTFSNFSRWKINLVCKTVCDSKTSRSAHEKQKTKILYFLSANIKYANTLK